MWREDSLSLSRGVRVRVRARVVCMADTAVAYRPLNSCNQDYKWWFSAIYLIFEDLQL